MPMTTKQAVKFVKKNGFKAVKGAGKGGHQKFHNPETNRTTEIPMHPRDLTKWEEYQILKQAGLLEIYRQTKA